MITKIKYTQLIKLSSNLIRILLNKILDKPEETLKDNLYDYLSYWKSELDKINNTLISECLYKAYKLRNILREYYSIFGKLAICDWIQKQLQPYFLPLYFKLYWYIDAWNMVFLSIVEKEKIGQQYSHAHIPSRPTNQSLSRSSVMASPNAGRKLSSRTSSPNATKSSIKLKELISKEDLRLKFERSTIVYNKLQQIQALIKDCNKYGWDKVKEDWNELLEDEQNEVNFISKIQAFNENADRKTKSSLGRRKTNELKLDTRASFYNITKEQIEGEQYSGFSDSDKEKKLSNFIENDFKNAEIDYTRLGAFLSESKFSDIFDIKEVTQGSEIDYEVSTFYSEPAENIEYSVIHKLLSSKNQEEEAIVLLNKTYKLTQDSDLDLKTVLERKTKYHKEMIKFYKLIQQTRAKKLIDFLNESRDSSLNEYMSIIVSLNSHYHLANYSLYPLLIPVSNFRNIEDLYFSIFLINEFIEKERKNNEINEITPIQFDDNQSEDPDAAKITSKTIIYNHYEISILVIPSDPTYYDPELTSLVAKYHKMEKHTTKLFSDIELVQGPLHLISSILNQENTIKNESSKLIGTGSGSASNQIAELFKNNQKQQIGLKNIQDNKISDNISSIEIERFDLIEERIQMMLEYLISKGTCSFLEQNDSKNSTIK